MGLIEGILCKVNHRVIDMIGLVLRNAILNTAGNILILVAVDEVLTFLLHDLGFLLAHGTADEVGTAKRIAAEIAHDTHDLLLIHDTAIGRLEDRLQFRCVIRHRIRILLAGDIFRDELHRPRAIEGDARDDVFEALRPQFLHEVLHAR